MAVVATISVIVPVYDRSTHLLAEALDSILAQTVQPDEIIVVDDGSPEPVAPWIYDNFGDAVSAITTDHGGIGAARNAGVAASSGSLLAFLDSDDLWVPNKLEWQLGYLEADTDLEAVFGRAQQFHDSETTESHRARYPIRHQIIDAWLSTALLIRAEAFQRVGPFAQQSGAAVDIEWMLRANDLRLRRRMHPEVVYRRRIHTSNISIEAAAETRTHMFQAVRDSLVRQRADIRT